MADPLKYFRVEARDILEQLQTGLLELERGKARAESVARLLRLAHTLKGAARVVKQIEIANLAHQLEDVLVPLRGVEQIPREQADRLLAGVDAIAGHIGALAAPPAQQPPAAPTANAVRQ